MHIIDCCKDEESDLKLQRNTKLPIWQKKKKNVKQSVQLTIVDRLLYYKVTVMAKARREYCPIYDTNGYKEEKAKELRE